MFRNGLVAPAGLNHSLWGRPAGRSALADALESLVFAGVNSLIGVLSFPPSAATGWDFCFAKESHGTGLFALSVRSTWRANIVKGEQKSGSKGARAGGRGSDRPGSSPQGWHTASGNWAQPAVSSPQKKLLLFS